MNIVQDTYLGWTRQGLLTQDALAAQRDRTGSEAEGYWTPWAIGNSRPIKRA